MPIQFTPKKEELKLAYFRTKNDRPHRCFIDYPYLMKWAEIDLEAWLNELGERISSGFQPHLSRLCWIPKANSLLRPGNILHLKDEVVYNLIVGRLYAKIHSILDPFQGEPDAAYILSPPHKNEWIKSSFISWDNFRKNSLRYLDEVGKFVVISDITGFYENIDIDKLLSDLRQFVGGTCPEIDLLRVCLRKWSARGDKGIPQGYSASDILSKVYAHSIDMALNNAGYRHLRYVDDIRIFCESRLRAKRAILDFSQYVHKKGLNLQSAKTKILSKTEAMSKFDGVKPVVDGIQEELIEEIRDEIEQEGPYVNPQYIDRLLRARKELPCEVLERTFKEYFAASNPAPFDKTLFHYLLNRLAKANSSIAVGYCLEALSERPEETEYILSYFAEISLNAGDIKTIVNLLISEQAIYDYQCYQMLKWFFAQNYFDENLLLYCRNVARDHNRDIWLRSYAVAYLGRNGDISDLHAIESLYSECSSDLERADCVMALSKLEIGRRNAFYASIANDGHLVGKAVTLVKRNIHQ